MALAFDTREFSTSWFDSLRKRRLIVLGTGTAIFSIVLARLVLMFDLAVVAGLFVWVAIAAMVWRPRYGVYLLLAAVLMFEGGSQDPLMAPGNYLNRSLQETLHVTGAIFIPLELMILLVAVSWLATGLMRRRLDFQGGAFGRPVLFFALALLFGVVRGLLAGAVFNFAFWESRFLFAMVLCYVLAANLVRTRGHVKVLLAIVMVCVTFSGIEGVWRRYALADSGVLGPAQELWYAHEDVVVWGLLVMLVVAQQVFGAPRWQRILGPPAVIATGIAMLVSERRAGIIAVIIAFVAFSMILFFVRRRAFMILVVPLLVATTVYIPLNWNNPGTLGQPARAIRSISDPDPRDAASNEWRGLEAINVRATIASDPLLGIGFGRPFLQIVNVPDISFFEFWNYESHHDILWVWMKTGALGFIALFMIITSGIARSVWLIKTQKDREIRVFAVLALSAILMSATFCYVDLGLTSARVPIILGLAIGTLGVLDRLRDDSKSRLIEG
jgi:hypothetical protein